MLNKWKIFFSWISSPSVLSAVEPCHLALLLQSPEPAKHMTEIERLATSIKAATGNGLWVHSSKWTCIFIHFRSIFVFLHINPFYSILSIRWWLCFSLDFTFQQIFHAERCRKILEYTALKDNLSLYEVTTEIMHKHVYPAMHDQRIEYVSTIQKYKCRALSSHNIFQFLICWIHFCNVAFWCENLLFKCTWPSATCKSCMKLD